MVYGIVIGLYYSYSTSLNDLLVRFFPNKNVDIGWLGLLLTVSGLVGSIVSGYVLDYTGRFKETFWGICILSFLTSIISSCLLHEKLIWVEYITITLFGFFLVSMFPVGLEYGIEVAYPESQIIITGLMNGSTMVFGIIRQK
ncbi:hypothetical protein AVEN_36909-1 [Araneus ventricosus]|uniref:Major facilitator superfamily (MFS) profile domain-containing protein n=1 Tax=Araneus ventricosus TaxID=182803 RepID=A0A4Y2MLD3_ARAVE|nr:hypothetical protein AVEN_36909-1 [Araneus ventricosus]